MVNPGVAGGWGVEVDRIKCDKAAAFLAQAAAALLRRGALAQALAVPHVRCAPVEQARCPLRGKNPQSLVGRALGRAPARVRECCRQCGRSALPEPWLCCTPLRARPCWACRAPPS